MALVAASVAAVGACTIGDGVMRHVGHSDSKMTMEVYAQLQQRIERHHGEQFDRLVEGARSRLAGSAATA